MGKVISLKLNKREKRIIERLNQEGITNSDLIRNALWYYFTSVNESDNEVDAFNEESLYQSLHHLKDEVNFLREQNSKIKYEFSEEIKRLKNKLGKDSLIIDLKEDDISPREQYASDIRKNIDKILKKR